MQGLFKAKNVEWVQAVSSRSPRPLGQEMEKTALENIPPNDLTALFEKTVGLLCEHFDNTQTQLAQNLVNAKDHEIQQLKAHFQLELEKQSKSKGADYKKLEQDNQRLVDEIDKITEEFGAVQ